MTTTPTAVRTEGHATEPHNSLRQFRKSCPLRTDGIGGALTFQLREGLFIATK